MILAGENKGLTQSTEILAGENKGFAKKGMIHLESLK